MKKHLIIAFVIFIVVVVLGLSSAFIRWDESSLEQSVFAIPLGIGLILQMPFLAIIRSMLSDASGNLNYQLAWTITPFVSGSFYAFLYFTLALIFQRFIKKEAQPGS